MVTPQVPCMNPSINSLLFDLSSFHSPQNCSSFFLTLFLTQDATQQYRVTARGGRCCFSLWYCKTQYGWRMYLGKIQGPEGAGRSSVPCPQHSHATESQILHLSLIPLGYFACCESLNKTPVQGLVSLARAARVRTGTLLRLLHTSSPRS